MKTTITGTIKSIGETNQITPKFKKRELVIETTGDYPHVKGREWISKDGTPKYFISLDVWKVTKESGETSKPDGIIQNFQEDAIRDMEPEDDGMPF